MIFYLGHTAAFYINKLIVARIRNERINPRFESMFAVGADEMSWDDLNEAHYDWPTLEAFTKKENWLGGIRVTVHGFQERHHAEAQRPQRRSRMQ